MDSAFTPCPAPEKGPRLGPIDSLRGLIILLMALDHANYFVARGRLRPELWADGFPDYHGNSLAFLTRFVTHPAAPGFFFLMGTGMVLFTASRLQEGWSKWQVIGHFVFRGLLLVLFQFFLENPAWLIGTNPGSTIYYGVLYGLGGTMIIASLLLYMPGRWLLILGMLLVGITELLLPDARTGNVQYAPVLRLWLLPGYSKEGFMMGTWVLYPLMPWLGVVCVGMSYGRWLRESLDQAFRSTLWLGVAALVLFFPIRLLNGFGNIRPLQGEDWIAFLNLVKYPPSITFLLLTLGANLILLSIFSRLKYPLKRAFFPLVVFGRAPLFFYLIHLYLYGYMGRWTGVDGVGIPRMVPYWLLGIVLLFPLCWGYGKFKHSRPSNSLWRFL